MVVCKRSRVGDYAVIREIGLRCDGAYFLGKTIADENLAKGMCYLRLFIIVYLFFVKSKLEHGGVITQNGNSFSLWRNRIPDSTFHLHWHTTEEGLEGGHYIDSGIYLSPLLFLLPHSYFFILIINVVYRIWQGN